MIPRRFPDLLTVQPGTLDDTSWFTPVGDIWTASGQPWSRLSPGELHYEAQPEDMLPLVQAWKAR